MGMAKQALHPTAGVTERTREMERRQETTAIVGERTHWESEWKERKGSGSEPQ